MKFRNFSIGVAALAMLLSVAQPTLAARSGGSACAEVTIDSTNASATVAPGGNIALQGRFHNCSDRKANYEYALTAISSCGQKMDLASGKKRLDANGWSGWIVSLQFPLDTCAGPWEATMVMSVRGKTLASASTTVEVY